MKFPIKIDGGVALDHRGSLSFINNVNLKEFVRFYLVRNKKKNIIRAWHGHFKESKLIICLEGKAKICAVQINHKKKPSKKKKIFKWTIDAKKKFSGIYIPKGYANGTVSLSSNMKLLVLSNLTLKQSLNDDYRFASNYWKI